MTGLTLTSLLADSDSWNTHHAGWGMAGMMVGMALFWGSIIISFVWLVRSGFAQRSQRQEETALSVLDRRFAEGTVSANDYHERRRILTTPAIPRSAQGAGSPARESEKQRRSS